MQRFFNVDLVYHLRSQEGAQTPPILETFHSTFQAYFRQVTKLLNYLVDAILLGTSTAFGNVGRTRD